MVAMLSRRVLVLRLLLGCLTITSTTASVASATVPVLPWLPRLPEQLLFLLLLLLLLSLQILLLLQLFFLLLLFLLRKPHDARFIAITFTAAAIITAAVTAASTPRAAGIPIRPHDACCCDDPTNPMIPPGVPSRTTATSTAAMIPLVLLA